MAWWRTRWYLEAYLRNTAFRTVIHKYKYWQVFQTDKWERLSASHRSKMNHNATSNKTLLQTCPESQTNAQWKINTSGLRLVSKTTLNTALSLESDCNLSLIHILRPHPIKLFLAKSHSVSYPQQQKVQLIEVTQRVTKKVWALGLLVTGAHKTPLPLWGLLQCLGAS